MNRVVDQGAKAAGLGVSALCDRVGMSRQNYYAARRLRGRRAIEEGLVLDLLRAELEAAGVSVGRDRFFALLAAHDLLVAPKPGTPRTTQSRHSLPVFHNRLAGLVLQSPNQAWVSDLTYIRTEEGFLFASLITDAYSRKIVGAQIGDSLEAEGCLRALEQALEGLPADQRPIHHSDRGCQYCCHEYVRHPEAGVRAGPHVPHQGPGPGRVPPGGVALQPPPAASHAGLRISIPRTRGGRLSGRPGAASAEAALRPWPFGPPLRGRAPRGLGARWVGTPSVRRSGDTCGGRPRPAPSGAGLPTNQWSDGSL